MGGVLVPNPNFYFGSISAGDAIVTINHPSNGNINMQETWIQKDKGEQGKNKMLLVE